MIKNLDLFKRYLKASGAVEIARRLFVMNAFDGTLTIMGVVIGAHLSGVMDPKVVITAGVGGSVAMGISGMTGAYMAERAERMRDLKKLQLAMLIDLQSTQVAEASRLASLVVAVVDGISPAACAAVLISPFLLVPPLSLDTAFYISLAAGLAILFLLGIFLARISEEQAVRSGLRMLVVGLVTILVVSLMVSPAQI
ncbi:MAG: VIT family protein [Methanosaeta sp. PtaB.Bin039]|nr:MAG: VIT family protein [Methanosaeta sp. PtaB.Bin039]OPY44558.1 MAG: VIT family protein [Methanosaeta sp. PtaU1.Bin028]HOT06450.1 hypothetical protein [Methanotrichaceae archaeon]HQF16221.1 hypothetical protein [Methanotrichaceae archaeon]HQI90957.1 hypothetical protein [Methanotrichaceae archaeon]